MKKLILFTLVSVLLFATIGCACGQTQTVTHRGELTIAYDRELTKELLGYFQANQDCIVTGILLSEQTNFETLADTASVALLKDETLANALRAEGWADTADWSDAQKTANEAYFNFIVLISPKATSGNKEASKLLTDWLAGDGVYEKQVLAAQSCSCSCSKQTKTVKIKSDVGVLAKEDKFQPLRAN